MSVPSAGRSGPRGAIDRLPPPLRRTFLPLLAVVAAFALTAPLHLYLGPTPLAFFYGAILLAAAIGGRGAGILAILLTAAGALLLRHGPAAASFRAMGPAAVAASLAIALAAVELAERGRRRGALDRARESEIARLQRLYAAHTAINQAIVKSADVDDLLSRVCRALVELGGFQMAWVGWHDPVTREIRARARWGDAKGYLDGVRIYGDDRPEGQGPTGTAFREDRAVVINDTLRDDTTLPWRRAAAISGFRASAVFPVRRRGAPCATLSVYAGAPGIFQARETALLEEAAQDLSYALDNLQREAERRAAEEALARERQLVDTIIASAPGVIYLYDESGRFLRWNADFTAVTGYTDAEVATMHPADFFRGDDQARVQERIAQVFATGSGNVEAGFVAKDGSATPYYFTGRRIDFEGHRCLVGMGIDLRERVRAEEEARELQRRFEIVAENLREGLVIATPDLELLYWNPAALRLIGFDDPAEGRALEHEFERHFELFTRDGVPLPGDHWPLARVRAGDTLDGLELRVRRRATGRERILSYSGGRVAYGSGRTLAFVTLQDITDRVTAEAERRRAKETVDQILASVSDAFVALDRNWRYVYVNERAARIFGRTPEQLIGKHIWTEFPEGVGQPFHAAYERAMRDRVEIQFEEYYAPYDTWFENRIYPSAEGISIVFQDIGARKRAELALLEAKSDLERKVEARTAELRAALVRAEAADRVKSAFLATMSHELRTPLNSIIGFTGILLQGLAGPLAPEQEKQLGMVRGSARHLLDLINDVLDISKIEAGQLETRLEPVDLRAAVERAVAAHRPAAAQKGLQLTVTYPGELPPLRTDGRRLHQILLNLVNNAVKFTDQGSVAVEVATGPSVRLAGGPAVAITVRDTGIGIRPGDLATLFQPFRQLDTGLARTHEGTGLGLAICRRLAELLGGEIHADSRYGAGSTFQVTLPLRSEP